MGQESGETNSDDQTPTDAGEGTGSDRGDWQKELADRLAAQKAKKAAAAAANQQAEETKAEADAEPEEEAEAEPKEQAKRSEEKPEWEQGLGEEGELDLGTTERSDLAGINATQRDWMAVSGQIDSAINNAATVVGDSIASITSFLAPVPAMLLVFLTLKVPIPIPIPVMYKPTTLSWSKKADWHHPGGGHKDDCSGKAQKTPMRNVQQATFKGGGPELLDVELFFDTTDTQLDVRFLIKPIQALVYMVPLRNEPPLVMFSWGMILSKMSYIEDLDIEYTMFRADGTPLRAEVSMTLTEYDMGWLSAIPMNPTSYSEARRTWVVIEGQTLDWIAYQEYGNAMHWRHIAQVNNLTNPRDLRSGQILKLTPLP